MGFIQTAVSVGVLVLSWRLYQSYVHSREGIKVVSQAKAEYDYIVIGAGSAGSLVSARLTEIPDITVLVLEAGPNFENIPVLNQPEQWWNNIGGEFDWRYKTVPQKHACLGSKNNQCAWPRGRIVGGSGSINALQNTRGSPFDFDGWESQGCTDWSFNDVLPYFLKLEDMNIEELRSNNFHNVGGPIAVSSGDDSPLAELYRKAGEEIGFKVISDYNGATQRSFNKIQINVRNGERSSSAKELLSGTDRPNLDILPEAHATKINFENKRAAGVTFIRDGRKHTARARKEIILSGGTIGSAQLLLLSGIGPKQHLNDLGIPVIEDLPVGHNLQDHSQVSMCTSINVPYSMTSSYVESTLNQLKYKFLNAGPKSMTASEGSAFLHLNQALENTTYPDIQFVFVSRLIGANIFDYSEDIADLVIEKDSEKHGFCTFVALTHPRARGVISLSSTDPFDHPLIDPRYFENHQDVLDLVGGIRIWEKLAQSKTMSDLGVDINELNKRFCSEHKFRSDDYWECYIRKLAFTQFHPTSSCKMGTLDDESTVVGPDLRVKGVAGLRVVDASVFPVITSGNTNTPTLMVAERAADLILDRKTL
ncbi:L-sorbose 1-dehydrogenase-like [Mya arenaria]|uniref:L-sorbose 1-dehydrogenase-like n=1 Tax=Mya arenaria TaxID=6604 RepID=UPI0022DF6941|nr:L-sorbose 1-dehydrogenase-like [Mya arenaria]